MAWWEWLVIWWGAAAALSTLVFCGACTAGKRRRATRSWYTEPLLMEIEERPSPLGVPGDAPVPPQGSNPPDRRFRRPSRGSRRLGL